MRIIHISDTHLTSSSITFDAPLDTQDSPGKIKIILDALKTSIPMWGGPGANVVIITGDLTDSGDESDYKIARDFIRQLQAAAFVVYAVPGNHNYCFEGNVPVDSARKQRFFEYIDSTTNQSSQYPQDINLGNCRLILLDSKQCSTSFARGKLGSAQLNQLKILLAAYETNRKNGTKIVVALHHHPFMSSIDNKSIGLDDADDFLGIISNKIDCLLFGHSTDDGLCQQSQQFNDKKVMYGIPIINCENLEHMSYSNGKISVADLDRNTVTVYPTDITQFPTEVPAVALGGRHITPIVVRSDTVVYNYSDAAPKVQFKPGDRVTLSIGGGVQTGGYGKTWKRYVNPSGNDSDHLYFGKIGLPGITAGLTPIRDLIPKYGTYESGHPDRCSLQIEIPNIHKLPHDNRYLELGYVDDDYGDNGYWGHDNGTDDQCKNVGPAYIDFTILARERTSSSGLICSR